MLRTRICVVTVALTGCLAVTPAAFPDSTPVSLMVTGGTLSISVPADGVSLGSRANTVGGGTISGQLGQVEVNDARSAAAGSGWVVSVISTAFTPSAGPAIPASAVSYSAGPVVKVGTASYSATNQSDLTALVPVVTATGITGDNAATWNPSLSVTIPGGAAAGTYLATITHSVL